MASGLGLIGASPQQTRPAKNLASTPPIPRRRPLSLLAVLHAGGSLYEFYKGYMRDLCMGDRQDLGLCAEGFLNKKDP